MAAVAARPGEPLDPDAAISIRGLVKRYGEFAAVDGLDLDIRRGEIFALLGPNGAGKTTTVEICEGYRSRDAGEVRVLGEDPSTAAARWKARLGIVLQSGAGDSQLTCRELLRAQASYYPDPRDPDEVLALVGLTEKAESRGKSLSGASAAGSTSRSASSAGPTLLFLDEPTTGFDPEARRQFWSLIRSLRDLGTTMLLTTHYLDEAEALADRVGVIARGRLVEVAVPSPRRPGDRARRRQLERGRRPPLGGDRHADGVRAGPGRPVPRRDPRPGGRPADPRGRLPADDRRPA